jgi:NAD(P)-dependent dehydrogenase (short-subunit alcohol dehydrogenase family)
MTKQQFDSSNFVAGPAIVTGAGRGIGLDIAAHLLDCGSNVLVYDIDAETGRAAVEQLQRSHPSQRVVFHCGDVADEESMREAFDLAIEHLGVPRILVNNAGVNDLRPLVRLSTDEWRRVFDVIALGTFVGTRELARRYMETGLTGGSVINTSSLNYVIATRGYAHYCAAKAAVSQFTRAAALELAPLKIRVNAIAPGLINTPLAGSFFAENPAVPQAFVDQTPLGRVGETSDVARVAVFLASSLSGWCTGLTIPVDGGANLIGMPDSWTLMGSGLGLAEPTPEEWTLSGHH